MNNSKATIFADTWLCNVFTSNRQLLQVGDKCHNVMLAKSLKAIAKYGPKVLYNGTIGVNLVKGVQRGGGILTFKDLQNYKVKVQNLFLQRSCDIRYWSWRKLSMIIWPLILLTMGAKVKLLRDIRVGILHWRGNNSHCSNSHLKPSLERRFNELTFCLRKISNPYFWVLHLSTYYSLSLSWL